jgi:hypothetical protein
MRHLHPTGASQKKEKILKGAPQGEAPFGGHHILGVRLDDMRLTSISNQSPPLCPREPAVRQHVDALFSHERQLSRPSRRA